MLSNTLLRRRAEDLVNRQRPEVPSTREPLAAVAQSAPDQMAEYARLSKSLGLTSPHIDADMRIERFKAFLRAKDWLVFDLATVCAYMDKKAEEESDARAGWHWRPLRAQDNLRDTKFGKAAFAQAWNDGQIHRGAASDHYEGPRLGSREEQMRSGGGVMWVGREDLSVKVELPASAEPYDKLVPLHALKKVAAITEEFREPVSFFVCDYAPAPQVEYPDPFLMAVINHPKLAKGVGRFVIDFWDEPGFGLEQQLA